jgi:transposase InsO family protein
LVGSANEVSIQILGMKVSALLDTGSTVSTVSRSFYDTHLGGKPIIPLAEVMTIECADGQPLPYDGYVEIDIEAFGGGDEVDHLDRCIFLVIPDSRYNSQVPLLIGTNLLSIFMGRTQEQYGVRFLQVAKLLTPIYLAYRCMLLRDRELEKHNNRLAIIKSAEQRITILPNSEVVIQGYLDKELPYQPVCALVQATSGSGIPDDLDITPTLVPYKYRQTGLVKVQITNVSAHTMTISPGAVLGEIQPVTIENVSELQDTDTDVGNTYLQDVDICKDGLSEEQIHRGEDLLRNYPDIFSHHEDDIGHTDIVRHRIELDDPTPFKQRHRRIPPSAFEEVRNHLQHLLATDIIRRSRSPWASPVVLVRKKDGKLRMCVDYRALNERTVKDSHALPRIEEILDALGGNKFFTVLDMKSGYHQVEVEEDHKARTAFTVGPLGFYEFNRLPFGLANSPATYQRLMEESLGDLNLRICFIYLDDVIIFSQTYEEHLDHLQQVFDRLRQTGFKLSPKKCAFFKRRVRYVGHIVSEDGIEPDPEKVEKVKTWPRPTNAEEVRRFLGFVGYYRRFVLNFSKVARPLSDIMPSTKKTSKTKRGKAAERTVWNWGPEQEEAFESLKQSLASPPILGYTDFSTPFELHTDACGKGLGAVLYQEQEGKKRVIGYASRGLNKAEKNYPAHKLEFLALKWAVTEKFHDYLYGQQFTVLTDNNPLTYVLTSAKLDATGHRWVAALASYNFSIIYRPGSSNADADGMSRLPLLTSDEDKFTIPTESVHAICNVNSTQPFIECLALSADAAGSLEDAEHLESLDVKGAQGNDPLIRWWLPYVKNGQRPRRNEVPGGAEFAVLFRNFDKLRLIGGTLYREVEIDGETKNQLVLPASQIPVVLKYVHNNMGHPGRDRTTSLLRDRFFWHGMTRDVDEWIGDCDRCVRRKTPTNMRAPLTSITSTQPLEIVCMDFLTLEVSKGGIQNILVITDHFTRYAVAVPTRNMTAHTTAEVFFNNFVVHYGFPQRIHTDQGANFESRLIRELCSVAGISKSHTTPYHPMGNGLCERFNRTLLGMLGTLENEEKRDWKAHVAPLVHAYNCTRQESTGRSPYFLIFGREPRLPVDLVFGLATSTSGQTLTKYADGLRQRLKSAYNIAARNVEKAQVRQKKNYDLKVRGAIVQPGDRVLVKIVAFEGKHKLSDKWEEDPYLVVDQPNTDIPVYTLAKENGEGRRRTLHRNLLLPIGAIRPEDETHAPRPKPRNPRQGTSDVNSGETPSNDTEDEDSSSDIEVMVRVLDSTTPVAVQEHHVDEEIQSDGDDDQPEDADSEGQEGGGDAPDSGGEPEPSDSSTDEDDNDESGDATQSPDTDQEEDTDQVEEELVPAPPEGGEDADGDRPSDDETGDDHAAAEADLEADRRPEPPRPQPRRSLRPKQKPRWMRTDEFVMHHHVPGKPDWKEKVEYLHSMTTAGLFAGRENEVSSVILKLLSGDT